MLHSLVMRCLLLGQGLFVHTSFLSSKQASIQITIQQQATTFFDVALKCDATAISPIPYKHYPLLCLPVPKL